jgi:hypothetical protein
MLKTKLSTAIALLAVISLLLVPAVYAAEGTTQGSFGAAASAPTVSIEIYTTSACDIVTPSMDPQTEYWAKVTVTENSQLKHLATVQATLYYDSDGTHPTPAPGTGNTQTCAILTWHADGVPEEWTIDSGGGSTTWAIVPLDCSHTDVTGKLTTGDWKFAFIPGKVATENRAPADWDAEGKATNQSSQSGFAYVSGKNMSWYGEISVTGSVNWGEVPLGLTFEDPTYNPAPHLADNITVNYIANGNYYENIASTDWDSGGETVTLEETGQNPPTLDGYFGLEASYHNTASDNVTVKKTPTYTSMKSDEGITIEAGNDEPSNRLWLSLSAAGILPGTYSGTIYYQIERR